MLGCVGGFTGPDTSRGMNEALGRSNHGSSPLRLRAPGFLADAGRSGPTRFAFPHFEDKLVAISQVKPWRERTGFTPVQDRRLDLAASLASHGPTALSRFGVRSMIDGGSDRCPSLQFRYRSAEVPAKSHANRQHVTLTVLFTAPIITLLGQLLSHFGGSLEICLRERYSQNSPF